MLFRSPSSIHCKTLQRGSRGSGEEVREVLGSGVAYIGGAKVDAEVVPSMASVGTRRGDEVVSEGAWLQVLGLWCTCGSRLRRLMARRGSRGARHGIDTNGALPRRRGQGEGSMA